MKVCIYFAFLPFLQGCQRVIGCLAGISNSTAVNDRSKRQNLGYRAFQIIKHNRCTPQMVSFSGIVRGSREVKLLAWHNANANASAASSGRGIELSFNNRFVMSIT